MTADELRPRYEIRVRGVLASRWAAWFDGMSLTAEAGGITVIRGPVADQAALHGLLARVRDVGLTLISLSELPPVEAPIEPDAAPHTRRDAT